MQNFTNTWKTVKLSDVTDYINRGIPPVYTQDSTGTVVVNQKCVRDEQVNFGYARLTDESARQVPQDKLLQPYDILINSTGTGTVGRVGQVVNLTQRATVDSHVTIVRPRKDDVDPTYLGVWLKAKQDELEVLAEGSSNQVELSRDKISNLKVLLPSIKTQRKIAGILSSVDEAIQKTDQIIQKTELLRQGLMMELLTKGIGHRKFKRTKLGEIPEEWSVKSFVDISAESKERNENESLGADLIMGVTKAYGLIPMKERIKGKDIKRYKRVKKNYFAYNPMRLNIGSIARWHGERTILVSPDYVVFSPKIDLVLPDYMDYLRQSFFWSSFTKRSGDGSVRIRIYYSHLSPLYFPLPSLDEQKKIVDTLKSIDEKLNIEKTRLVNLQNLKVGLMQDIFNQKVEVH